ncbi:telomere repeat-binding protein 5-like [Cucurbita moschata]|uniref:Telomere repeat-binding protein 5-like n=1 Tax=Cucurbita moschata TaxID=3662 RepID=A0A6J1HM23_CUCMO|nr:telomere repeat-binding protein 5-like [Cucurbita moschata]XP_022964876.1 telomere repeat-binding protein 5-like [Cucurbita moschata]
MVLQKRLDYGFHGYQVPTMPRATRSVRKRSLCRKGTEGSQMRAFDLLATVADKLLHGADGPTTTTTDTSTEKDRYAVMNKELDANSLLKVEPSDRGSCDQGFVSELVLSGHEKKCDLNGCLPQHDEDSPPQLVSVVTNFDKSKEMGNLASEVHVGSPRSKESDNFELDGKSKVIVKYELHKTEEVLTGTQDQYDSCKREDPVIWDQKAHVLGNSNGCGKMTQDKQIIQNSSFATQNNVKLVDRDDDENSSGCTHPVSSIKSFRTVPSSRDRRIKKVSASKSWKVVPRCRDESLSKTDGIWKSMFRSKSSHDSCRRQKSQMNIPFKKRKFFDCSSSVSNSDCGINSEGLSDSTGKVFNSDTSGRSCSASGHGHHKSFPSKDSHVKIRIKSFRVPELFIEISETATVGSLKRTVMEAVTAVLGGGIRVGVLLQGKKVRDDNKTLFQTGISHDNQLDSLGFALEPNPSRTPLALCQEDSPCILPCDAPEPLTRYSPDASADHPGSSNVLPEPHGDSLGHFIESDHDSAPSPTNTSNHKSTTDSKALVNVPAMTVEALTIVPMHRKSKRSEVAQRRIRRPFSVAEVEALVQAVEKLGTGRWRDVKLRAFDNAKHRTYVDLKDKWKTLVHTARISPQQRRGEPVPQELLDRVLSAHAYWSKQQAKYQLKRQPETTTPMNKKTQQSWG